MKRFSQLIFGALVAIIPFSAYGEDKEKPLSSEEIVQRSFDAGRPSGSEAVTTLSIFNEKGQSRVRKIAMVSKLFDDGKTEKRLIKFLEPADVKGTGLLTYDYEEKDDDIWFFAPALRKTRRIVASEKAKSFMGSEFTYADMTPPAIKDFAYKLLKEEKVKNDDCYVVEATPKNEEVAEENGYSKKISYIGKKDFVVRKAVYYDLDGELLKELTVKEFKEIDPKGRKYRITNMEMLNKQNNRRSTILLEKVEFNPNVSDDYFTTRYLERL
ncbi:MAG: outer membrane lipoprotein-sorting protein [Myxococcota bacterium]